MKRITLLAIIFMMTMSSATKGQNQVLTPETLWEFGRISDVQVSPSGRRYCLASPIMMYLKIREPGIFTQCRSQVATR